MNWQLESGVARLGSVVAEFELHRGARLWLVVQRTMNEQGKVLEHDILHERHLSDRVREYSKWHSPIRQNTRATCRIKLNSLLPEISLVPAAVCSVLDRN